MPKDFPGPPDSHGAPTWITYYTATEAARFLHVSPVTFRQNCRNGLWPHLRWQRGYFVNAAQMDRIRELSTLDIDAIPKWEPDGRIGEVRSPWDDEEGVQ